MEEAIIGLVDTVFGTVGNVIVGNQNKKIARTDLLNASLPKYEDIFPKYLVSQSKNNLIIIGILAFLIIGMLTATVFVQKKK